MNAVRRGLRSTFSSLDVRNYRLFFAGQVVSISGTFMQMVAQAWLVLDLTGSAAALGIVTAVQFLPTLLLGPYGGVVADRVDKRRILLATQVAAGLLAVALGVIVAAGVARLWMVIALAAALGLTTAFDSPARQSFVLEMVGPDRLTNALSLNTIVLNVGRLFGPALAGIVIARWDVSVCFIANGLSYVAPTVVLLAMRPDELLHVPRAPRSKGQLREGLRHVWARPSLRVPLLLMLAIGTLTYEFTVTLPVLAKRTFGVGAGGYGAMQSVMSVGAIVGGLALASRAAPTYRRLVASAVGFGAMVIVLALCPTYGVAMVALPFVGAGSALFLALVNSTLQLASSPEMRSRVMALYAVAFLGSTPVGGPIVGRITESFGARWGVAVGGITALVSGIAAAGALRGRSAPAAALVDDERIGDNGAPRMALGS